MNETMFENPIYIIGAGAIGKALAVFLHLADKRVFLVRGSVSGEPTADIAVQVNLASNISVAAAITHITLDNLAEINGLILLTNKSFGNIMLAEKIKDKIKGSPVVLLQNGLGVEEPFIKLGYKSVYRCVLFATSQPVGNNIFRFQPVAESAIGIVEGSVTELEAIVSQLKNNHFPFKAETGIQTVIWKKAITNVVFNSICPLLEIDNGVFHRNETALKLAHRLVNECTQIAEAIGIELTNSEVLENVVKISKASDGQHISTLQDIRHHRPTEIDTFNFEVVRIAQKMGKEHLVTETKLLGELTKLKSELNLINS
ncbi:MAG: ketopantoate reductase family protein [Cytophagales bacterium]